MTEATRPEHRPPSPEQLATRQSVAEGKRGGVGGPSDVWSQNPELAAAARELSDVLRMSNNGLGPRLTELATLVVARAWTAQIEWFAHAPRARKEGISGEVIACIAERRTPTFERDDERVVYEYAHQLSEKRKVEADTFNNAVASLGVSAVVNLTTLIGFYGMVASILHAYELAPPAGTKRLLPG
jgi:4-carboxymuconolactone decarboxylase